MQSTLGSADPQSLESAVAEPAESEWLAIGRICSCGTRRIRVVGDWSNLQLRNPQFRNRRSGTLQMRNSLNPRAGCKLHRVPVGPQLFLAFGMGGVVVLESVLRRYPGKAEFASLLDNLKE